MIKFKVYGAGDLESLVDNIVEWMHPYKMSYEIEEVNDIDRIMLDGIQSVPSVKILIEADLEQRDYEGYDGFVVALRQLSNEIGDVISRSVPKDRMAGDPRR